MNDRLRLLRKSLKMTQQTFANKIGLKRNTVANYEIGNVSPSDRTIADICREFDANEIWLRTGEGEMFVEKSRDEEIAAFMGNVMKGEPDFRRKLVAVLSRMTADEWALLEKKVRELLDEQ